MWTSCISILGLERADQDSFPEPKVSTQRIDKSNVSKFIRPSSHMAILPFTQTSSLTPEFLAYYLAPLVVWSWMKSWETWLSSLPIPANKNNSHWFLKVEMIHFSLCMNPWSCKQPGIGAGKAVPEALVVILSLETNVVPWLPQASQQCCDLECWWASGCSLTSPEPATQRWGTG